MKVNNTEIYICTYRGGRTIIIMGPGHVKQGNGALTRIFGHIRRNKEGLSEVEGSGVEFSGRKQQEKVPLVEFSGENQ